MASLTNGHELRKLWETVKDREACHAVVVHRVAKSQMQLSNWTKILSENSQSMSTILKCSASHNIYIYCEKCVLFGSQI